MDISCEQLRLIQRLPGDLRRFREVERMCKRPTLGQPTESIDMHALLLRLKAIASIPAQRLGPRSRVRLSGTSAAWSPRAGYRGARRRGLPIGFGGPATRPPEASARVLVLPPRKVELMPSDPVVLAFSPADVAALVDVFQLLHAWDKEARR